MCSTATRRGSMSSCLEQLRHGQRLVELVGFPVERDAHRRGSGRIVHALTGHHGVSWRDLPMSLPAFNSPPQRARSLPPARARTRALFDLLDSAAYFEQADRAAQSDRLLRRPPAGLRGQHADQERARPARHRRASRDDLRARHRSGGGSRGRRPRQPGLALPRRRARVRRRGGRAYRGRDRDRRRRRAAIIRCCATRRRSGRLSSTRRCTRRRSPTCGIGSRTRGRQSRRSTVTVPPRLRQAPAEPGRVSIPAGIATLGTADDAASLRGTTNVRRIASRSPRSRSTR